MAIETLMTITIKKGSDSGLFFATSEDAGTMFVAAADLDSLCSILPIALDEALGTNAAEKTVENVEKTVEKVVAKKFAYHVVRDDFVSSDTVAILNTLGRQGWELVTIIPPGPTSPRYAKFFFKKEQVDG